MTSLNDEDLRHLQEEVQRMLGRCLLRLQQYERLIKALVAQHSLSGPLHDIERVRAERVDGTARKTLGFLVGELLGSYVVADEFGPPKDSTANYPGTLDWIAMRMTVRLPDTEFARVAAVRRARHERML